MKAEEEREEEDQEEEDEKKDEERRRRGKVERGYNWKEMRGLEQRL